MVSTNGLKKLIIYGFILHLIFFASIFEIYFQSPIVQGLTPLEDLKGAPAKRLVLFVADGLRAESFYKDDLRETPFLKKILLQHKVGGISHTHVPTESRPGHVALIAGFYEDPSAVAKGWQENPVNFDSVFNRSRLTYSWGSPDILPIFAKEDVNHHIMTDSYNSNNEDFSGKLNTSELDIWVFNKVKHFLENPDNVAKLIKSEKVIFFLHLLGLDTAGHVHKPHSPLFIQNLNVVDSGIQEIVHLFEKIFQNDKKTSYIFTADHGMTDRGSHGAGLQHETETPFLAWGAGLKTSNLNSDDYMEIEHRIMPKINIEQASIASLMATLIGVSVPVNNVGKLPDQILDVSDEYLAEALKNNAFQITLQFEYWMNKFEKAKFQFLLGHYNKLSMEELFTMKSNINKNLGSGFYQKSIVISRALMDIALEGIDYYQSYYQTHLLFAITLSLFAWLLFLFQQLLDISDNRKWNINPKNIIFCIITSVIVLTLCFVQGIPLRMGFYFILPVICWSLLDYSKRWIYILTNFKMIYILYFVSYIILTEMFVLAFFYRFILTILLVMISFSFYFTQKRKTNFKIEKNLHIKWFITCVILSVFPSLPVVDKNTSNNYFLFLGITLWTIKSLKQLKQQLKNNYNKLSTILIIIFVINFCITIYQLKNQRGLHWINQLIAWIILLISFINPLFSSLLIQTRITVIGDWLFVPFCLMSLNYEPLFFLALFMNLYVWLKMENNSYKNKQNELKSMTFSGILNEGRSVEWDDIRRAYFILLYILVSFFGTGNIASVSSFDPNWVRCLVSTFSPFLMAGLIIIKLLMPILLVTCILKAIHVITEISMEKMFIIILIICDTLCLNFLYLVTNKGSWLEIGTSISHFVIMEFTVLVLFILYCISNILTSYKINLFNFNKRNSLLLPQTFDQPKTK